jgi:hypothetical protein
MWQKAFHVVLVSFLVIFTAIVLMFLMAGLSGLLFPRVVGSHNGIYAYSGGVSLPLLKFVGILVLFGCVLIISLVARRRRLR